MPRLNASQLRTAKLLAKRLGVSVKPSTRKGKKLDVYLPSGKVVTIGHADYEDYLQHGDAQRRRNYKSRMSGNRHKRGTAGYYADQILWPTDEALRKVGALRSIGKRRRSRG